MHRHVARIWLRGGGGGFQGPKVNPTQNYKVRGFDPQLFWEGLKFTKKEEKHVGILRAQA